MLRHRLREKGYKRERLAELPSRNRRYLFRRKGLPGFQDAQHLTRRRRSCRRQSRALFDLGLRQLVERHLERLIRFSEISSHRLKRLFRDGGYLLPMSLAVPFGERHRARRETIRVCTAAAHDHGLSGGKYFFQILDFRKEPSLESLFADSLKPRSLVFKIEMHTKTPIDLANDLIIFDEVGDCQRALDSLRYFALSFPHAFACATGPNIGLLVSFPVGAVRTLELFPLCCKECLMAASRRRLLDACRNRIGGRVVHQHRWSQLLDFYFVGGMPEAVARWFDGRDELLRRTREVTPIHRDLVTRHERDFGKNAGRLGAQHRSERHLRTCRVRWPPAKMALCAGFASRACFRVSAATKT